MKKITTNFRGCGIEEVGDPKTANNLNLVVAIVKQKVKLGPLFVLTTPFRIRKMVDLMKFTKKVLEVIDKGGVDADSKSTDTCSMQRVVELLVVNKGIDAEGVVVCLTHGNNQNGPVCCEFKNI